MDLPFQAWLTRRCGGIEDSGVLSLRRTGWHHREECLIAGAMTTLWVRVRDLPREVVSLHLRVERYLKRHSQRLDPFETCQFYATERDAKHAERSAPSCPCW